MHELADEMQQVRGKRAEMAVTVDKFNSTRDACTKC